MVGNSLIRQKVGIPMGIEMFEFTSNDKLKARHFHATKHFIDLCT